MVLDHRDPDLVQDIDTDIAIDRVLTLLAHDHQDPILPPGRIPPDHIPVPIQDPDLGRTLHLAGQNHGVQGATRNHGPGQ